MGFSSRDRDAYREHWLRREDAEIRKRPERYDEYGELIRKPRRQFVPSDDEPRIHSEQETHSGREGSM